METEYTIEERELKHIVNLLINYVPESELLPIYPALNKIDARLVLVEND